MINGYVSAMGRKYGVPTPFNDLVVKIITDIEEGRRKSGIRQPGSVCPAGVAIRKRQKGGKPMSYVRNDSLMYQNARFISGPA